MDIEDFEFRGSKNGKIGENLDTEHGKLAKAVNEIIGENRGWIVIWEGEQGTSHIANVPPFTQKHIFRMLLQSMNPEQN